jgi:hypothetical protein
MSFFGRIGEIFRAVGSAKIPPPPKRRYDLVGEAMARPFGETTGRGPVRAGGVTEDDEDHDASSRSDPGAT